MGDKTQKINVLSDEAVLHFLGANESHERTGEREEEEKKEIVIGLNEIICIDDFELFTEEHQ